MKAERGLGASFPDCLHSVLTWSEAGAAHKNYLSASGQNPGTSGRTYLLLYMGNSDLTPDELAGLVAIDGTLAQRRPAADIEIRLRQLGLIDRHGLSRLPLRTERGDDLVRAYLAARPAGDEKGHAYDPDADEPHADP